MKVLFLDIDGVLNRQGTKERFNGFIGIDTSLLNKFTAWLNKKTDVDVVLSSTWRKEEAFRNHLKSKGLSWIDCTPHLPGLNRGAEIKYWLNQHIDVVKYAILDDTSDMSPVGRGLVQTSETYGLQDKHLRRLDVLLT